MSLAGKHPLVLSLAATPWIKEKEGRGGLCSWDFPICLHVTREMPLQELEAELGRVSEIQAEIYIYK